MPHRHRKPDDELAATKAWLHRFDVAIDHDMLDRVCDLVMDGMLAMGTGPAAIPPRLMALIKVMAMMLAALQRTGDPEAIEIVQGFYRTIGGALECEVERFTKAVRQDERRAARAVASVS